MTLKISAICRSEEMLATLDGPLLKAGGIQLSTQVGSAQALAGVLRRDQPDVVLLDLPAADEAVMEQIEAALVKAPATHMVLVSGDRSVEFLMRAMRAGVREVLPQPMNAQMVLQAAKHALGHQHQADTAPDRTGKVLALISVKGGAGSTFLAANLAYALAHRGRRVALLDLNLYLGDAAAHLGNDRSAFSLVDLARQTARMDATLLDASMIKVSENLHVLAAPESLGHASEVSAEALGEIVELTRAHYDFVVLDLSGALDALAIKALDLADSVYLTMQMSLPQIRAARLMVPIFKTLGYSRKKLHVVVNRYEKGRDISLADVEQATSLKVARTIPNSHAAVEAAVNQGVPLLKLAPRDPVARAIREWAEELVPSSGPRRVGWLKGLLGSPS